MPEYGLHWLPMNTVYFDPTSNTVICSLEKFGSYCRHIKKTLFF